MRTIYLDYNATTPLDPGVAEAMAPFLSATWGNPSSVHHVGRAARAALDDARDCLAAVLGCRPTEIIFTSGGTEASNLAVLGSARRLASRGRHLIVSAVEHHAVLHPAEYLARREGFELSVLPVDGAGRVSLDSVAAALRPDTVLVSVMAANNEVGTLQPVAEIGALCRQRGVLFHTDAVQWFGKQPFLAVDDFCADLVSLCGHKFFGPKGSGALFIRSGTLLDPILFGGAHELEHRAGTENVAAIVGLAAAAHRFIRDPIFASANVNHACAELRKLLLLLPGASLWSPLAGCLVNTVAATFPCCDSLSLLAGLDLEGICASAGSACSAGSLKPSHVLRAMGASAAASAGLVRFSLGPSSSVADLPFVAEVLRRTLARVVSLGSSAYDR